MIRPLVVGLVLGSVVGVVGCSTDDEAPGRTEGTSSGTSTSAVAPTESAPTETARPDCPAAPQPAPADFDQALHDELLRMLERDQAGLAGGRGFVARTERLRELLAVHGWPGFDLVGEDGEDAAWAIAQHADHDVEFQRCALAFLEDAVERGQGSPGNAAYLADRVAVADGEPQRYGTQVQCGPEGPEPSTPLVDPKRLDAWRAEADLPPYQDYLDQMTTICAESG